MSVVPHPLPLEAVLGKNFQEDSPGSSSTEQISACNSSTPSTGVPQNAQTVPTLRNGTIIKGHRRIASNLRPASGYKLKEKSAPSEGKWVFIVNGLKIKQWEQVAPRLLKQLSLVEVKVYATKYPGHGRRLAERAARNGADLVGAVGGDGTLNEVVDGVMRAGVRGPDGLPRAVVTILPLGTASDFHRSMAWQPNNFDDGMWRIGKRGQTAIIDVAHIQCASPEGPKERYFINVASCGAPARAALKVDKWRWMGQKAGYRMASVGAFFRHKPQNLAVRVDGGEWKKQSSTTLLAVGNGGYYGNGLNICPDASPYSSQLQVVTGKRLGVCDFLFNRHRLKMGKHLEMKGYSAESAGRIDVALWDNGRQGPSQRDARGVLFEQQIAVGGGGGGSVQRAPPPPSPQQQPQQQTEADINGVATAPQQQQQQQGMTPSLSFSRTESLVSLPDDARNVSAREWSGSEHSGRSGSTMSSWHRPNSASTAATAATREREDLGSSRRSRPAGTQASSHQKKEFQMVKEADLGPVPVEVDGEVIGHAPFSVTVLPGALKFRV